MTGDESIELITSTGDKSQLDDAAKALLRECFHDYPLDKLRTLLGHSNHEVVKVGVWVVSELGARGKPLLNDIVQLLDHETPYVRFFAIDSVLSCATQDDGTAVARVVRMLADPESSVRWKTTQFLMRASREKLNAASQYLVGNDVVGLGLLTAENVADEKGMVSMLRSDDPSVRRFALAAAYRARETSQTALQIAAESDDPEIREIAQRELE